MFIYIISDKSVSYKTEILCFIDWVVGAQWGPCFMTESQYFPVRPNQTQSISILSYNH